VSQRWVPAFILGVLVTLTLFWLMQTMVLNSGRGLRPTDDIKMVEFVRLKRDTTIKTKKRALPEKPPPKKRPPPPKMTSTQRQQVKTKMPKIDVPNLEFPTHNARIGGSLVGDLQMGGFSGEISSNLIPIFRVPPRYPMRAASRRIEGWVRVEFTITELGTVTDAEVIEAHPNSIFNRAALRAIAKWKFKPKLVAGEPVEQRALQVLQFKLKK